MQVLRNALRRVEIGPPATWENLAVFPLLADVPDREPGYVTLDEALAAGRAHVTEVSEAGRVPELRFVNEGDRPVLLLDGEELQGAKQNRVLDVTVLVDANSALTLPVSCVEAGRWAWSRADFEAAPHVMYSALRAAKIGQVTSSLRHCGVPRGNQAEVWEGIASKSARFSSFSPTGAMSDLYRDRSNETESYVRELGPVDGQLGAVFAMDGEIAGCELFDHPATLRKLLPKIVRSYALDAVETRGRRSELPAPEHVRTFLEKVATARKESFPAVGLGEDVRVQGRRLAGAALVEKGLVVHLTAFLLREDEATGGGEGPRWRNPFLVRMSRRRNHARRRRRDPDVV